MTNFKKVAEFHKTFGHLVEKTPKWPDDSVIKLRIDLILEELKEFGEGIDNKNIISVADALADILYVVYGAGHEFGVDLDSCFEEVHRSNMSKLGADGKPIYREDGKVLKGPNYSPPDLETVLESQTN